MVHSKPYSKLKISSIIKISFFVFAILTYIALTVICGAQWFTLPVLFLVFAFYLIFPGYYFLNLLPQNSFPAQMRFSIAFLLGSVFLCVAYVISMRIWIAFIYIFPLPFALAEIASRWRKRKNSDTILTTANKKTSLINVLLFLGLIVLIYGIIMCVRNAYPSAFGMGYIQQDFLWNVGNAAALKKQFPPWDLRFTGIRLQYHFFTELLTAIFSIITGFSNYEILLFGQQPLLLAVLVFVLIEVSMFLFKNSKTKRFLLLAFLFTASSASLIWARPIADDLFGNYFIYHLLSNLNGQTTTVIMLAIFTGLYTACLQKKYKIGLASYFLIFASFILLCVTKGPAAAILACALIVALLWALITKKFNWQCAVSTAGLVGIFIVTFLVLFRGGASSSMQLTTMGTLGQSIFGPFLEQYANTVGAQKFLLTLLCVLLQTILIAPLPVILTGISFFKNFPNKISLEKMFYYSVAGGGMLASIIFTHEAYSQTYFFFTALFFMCILSANILPPLWKNAKKIGKTGLSILIVITIISSFSYYMRIITPNVNILLGQESTLDFATQYTPEDEAAALWLKKNTSQKTIFATNRIHGGDGYKGISNYFSAMAERQAFMEAYHYVQTNMGIPWQVLESHMVLNNRFFDEASTKEIILQNAADTGASFVIYCTSAAGSDTVLREHFPTVYDENGTTIFKITS